MANRKYLMSFRESVLNVAWTLLEYVETSQVKKNIDSMFDFVIVHLIGLTLLVQLKVKLKALYPIFHVGEWVTKV